jgi:hypothetical protein
MWAEFKVQLDQPGYRDHRAIPDRKACLGQPAQPARAAQPARKDRSGQRARSAQPVLKAIRVHRGYKALVDLRARLVPPGRSDHRVILARKARRA